MFVCNSELSSWAETARTEVRLGAPGSHWPVISEQNRPIINCDMKTCVSVVLEACLHSNVTCGKDQANKQKRTLQLENKGAIITGQSLSTYQSIDDARHWPLPIQAQVG